jgi:hypothetical protein
MILGGRIALVGLALAGCGRIHYDPLARAPDAGRVAFVAEGVDADQPRRRTLYACVHLPPRRPGAHHS